MNLFHAAEVNAFNTVNARELTIDHIVHGAGSLAKLLNGTPLGADRNLMVMLTSVKFFDEVKDLVGVISEATKLTRLKRGLLKKADSLLVAILLTHQLQVILSCLDLHGGRLEVERGLLKDVVIEFDWNLLEILQ